MLQKWNLGYGVLPHLPYSPPDLSPTDCHFFRHLENFFAGKMLPQPAGCRKCFPRFHQIPNHGFLCYIKKSTFFFIGRIVFIIMVPILINKDLAESSDNELKFMVQNHSNIWTNLNSCLKRIKGRFRCGGNRMIRLLKSIIVCGNATWHQFNSVA